jgi:hypothetical protein
LAKSTVLRFRRQKKKPRRIAPFQRIAADEKIFSGEEIDGCQA